MGLYYWVIVWVMKGLWARLGLRLEQSTLSHVIAWHWVVHGFLVISHVGIRPKVIE